jgi:hypothetical protein
MGIVAGNIICLFLRKQILCQQKPSGFRAENTLKKKFYGGDKRRKPSNGARHTGGAPK